MLTRRFVRCWLQLVYQVMVGGGVVSASTIYNLSPRKAVMKYGEIMLTCIPSARGACEHDFSIFHQAGRQRSLGKFHKRKLNIQDLRTFCTHRLQDQEPGPTNGEDQVEGAREEGRLRGKKTGSEGWHILLNSGKIII
jgi:hypothetical protein